jgi:hypothetical protein
MYVDSIDPLASEFSGLPEKINIFQSTLADPLSRSFAYSPACKDVRRKG